MKNTTRLTDFIPVPNLPIYCDERTDKPTYERVFGDGPRSIVCRLPELIGVDGAYALYAVRTCMAPVIEPDDTLFINTSIPPLPGKLVFLLPSNPDGDVMVRRLIEETDEKIVVRQENPENEITLERSDFEAMHVIQYIRKFS